MQQFDVDVTDADRVAVPMRGQLAAGDTGDAGDPLGFVGVDVHGHTDPLQQLGEPLELEAHHRTAHVVGMMMGDQHPDSVIPSASSTSTRSCAA